MLIKTLLMCHEGNRLSQEGLARWLASFSNLTGIVKLREPSGTLFKRVRSEMRRVGPLRLLDVLAFRIYYKLRLAQKDRVWMQKQVTDLCERFHPLPDHLPVLLSDSPNTPEVARFVTERAPDVIIAVCKQLIHKDIFTIAQHGTYVMHPGICPEYRNSHGCFWALAHDDLTKVGMTLLRIDQGIDTGPILGYYSSDYDELNDSHIVIQTRVVLDNLDAIGQNLIQAVDGRTTYIETQGRPSAVWGQPWLTAYMRWKKRARQRAYRT